MVKKLMATLLACFAMTAFAGVVSTRPIRPRSNPCEGHRNGAVPPAIIEAASKVPSRTGQIWSPECTASEATTRPVVGPGVDGQRCRVLARQQQGESSVDAPLTRNRRTAVTRSPAGGGPDST